MIKLVAIVLIAATTGVAPAHRPAETSAPSTPVSLHI